MSKAKWGVHCQLNDANYLERIFTASQISAEISGNIHPEIVVSQLTSLAAQLHSQQAGAAQWRRIHCTGQCTVSGYVTCVGNSGIVKIYDFVRIWGQILMSFFAFRAQ